MLSHPALRRLTLGSLAALAVSLGGCAFTPGEVSRVADDEKIELGAEEGRGAWLFWPTSIRILPLTRLARGDATNASPAATIEVRVEALDTTGEPTRAVGTFIIAVECPNAEPSTQRFKIELASLKAHSERFDQVTDTYRFDVTPQWTTPPERGTKVNLKVILYGADGATPTATAAVTW
jgi:hypothetical protein